MKHIKRLIRSQPVLFISLFAALVTVFIIPPDKEYLGYCNYNVLIQLFALMTAVAGLRGAGVFDVATRLVLKKTGSIRRLGIALTLICFFSSMLVTNDVALITFVPLTIILFRDITDEKSRILTIVLETAAANMGSIMTPVGNPQNLFLYDEYGLTPLTFLKTMLPVGAVSLVCLLLLTLLLPKTACLAPQKKENSVSKLNTAVFASLFLICILTVLRILPVYVCLAAAAASALIFDRSLFKKVDYALLGTFVCFFIFVGNIARIEAVNSFFSGIMLGRELVVSVLLSQVISNVPAAVMLSGFTENGVQLLLGVNLGGLGTLIASLASLISFQFYRKSQGAETLRYFAVFSAVNFGMLILLTGLELLLQTLF